MAKNMKITELSKDFAMKSKDVCDAFREIGVDKNSGGSVSDGEFESFMQHMTSTHQIGDIDAYMDGKVSIRSVRPKKEEKPAAKAEPKPEVKAEEKPAPKSEEKPEAKVAPKPEAKPAERPAARPESRPAQGQGRPDGRPAQNQRSDGQARPDNRPAQNQRSDGQARPDNRPAQGQGRPDGRPAQGQGRPDNRDNRGRDNRDNRGYQGQSKYSAAPSSDPFAKRREDMNRSAQGYRKPDVQGRPDGRPAQGQRPDGNRPAQGQGRPDNRPAQGQGRPDNRPATTPAPVAPAAPAASANTARPAQMAQQAALEKKQKAQENAAKATPSTPKKEEKKQAQKQQYKTITPAVDRSSVKGGVNIGAEAAPSTAPGKRVVDMRSSDVDLSKYDDRYNDKYMGIARGTDTATSKTKLKKQDNRGQNQKGAKDKERAAQEKMKRLEAERARAKQLEVTIPEEITVSDFAARIKKSSGEVIKKLMMMGEMKGMNDVIDFGTAEVIADEFGVKVTKEVVVTIEEKLFTEAEDKEEDLVERAPVVCVMGHVDHGKTSILDAIRHTNVTRGEAGGITQAIGAYRVKINGKDITFLDTPGHEAFTAMRMRGAQSTDIAILVVAADDGVMPQTVEAINHAKAAGIDIIVAINKMDKPTANPDNVLNQLTTYELVPEAWGGDVITVPCSAHTKMGIEDLLESVLLVAEVKELRANPTKRAKGIVIESKLDKGRGPVATILVQNGTLHQGDYVIVGTSTGRVRAMVDDKGKTVKSAGPSVPVEIIGLDDVPQAGDELNAVEDEKMARSLADQRREKQRQEILSANSRMNLDDLFSRISEGTQTLNIIVKADVAGSCEAVKASLLKLSNDEVKVNIIHTAVGGITENDVMLASASDAIIVGFNVRPDRNALESAERNGVDIRTHRIIYEIIDEIEAAMKGMLAPEFREVILGHAEVRQCIKVPGVGIIAGCYVQDGKITRNASIRIMRDGVILLEDKIASLRRFKDDVKEVNAGYECGVGIEKFNDIREGDALEAFIMEEVAR